MKVSLLILLFALISNSVFCQKKQILLVGKIKGYKQNVSNIHIVNLMTEQVAVTNENGNFKIYISLNDMLYISSLSYINKRITITQSVLNKKEITIQLTPEVVMLEEVFLHNLSGSLEKDLNRIPKDKTPKINFKYHPSDLSKITSSKFNLDNKPNALALTDPTSGFSAGVGSTLPDFALEAERKLKKQLKEKIKIPEKLIKQLGVNFFVKDLKIPENEIYRFIDFCGIENLVSLYQKKDVLQIIKILIRESKEYAIAKK